MDYSLIAAFSIGLVSVLHCIGMCGGIIGALTLSLPADIRAHRGRVFVRVLAYNVGRISSYAIAGAVMGGVGSALLHAVSPKYGHLIAQAIAGLVLLGIGLYLAGWFPGLARVELAGARIWRWLEPLGRRLVPVRSPARALAFGAVWGWLPCGLVYTMLIWSTGAGGAGTGAMRMAAFGLGTLPGVAGAGMLADWMVRLGRLPWVRRAVGVAMVAAAAVSWWMVWRNAVLPATGLCAPTSPSS